MPELRQDSGPSGRASDAPVALFAFKRPEHTRRVLESLARNPRFEQAALHVFCDAARSPKEADAVALTRQVVRAFPHPHKTIVEAEQNRGLAQSVVAGVSALCEQFGRTIVIEDDLLVAPTFLDYMNRALDRYETDPQVMQVSGHMYPMAGRAAEGTDSVMLPLTTSWGWATWQRAWRHFDAGSAGADRLKRSLRERYRFDLDGSYPYHAMLQSQLAGESDSWAIRWYLSVYLASGQVLFPCKSLIENIGFDGSGTHCEARPDAQTGLAEVGFLSVEARSSQANADVLAQIKRLLRQERGIRRQVGDWRRRLIPSRQVLKPLREQRGH